MNILLAIASLVGASFLSAAVAAGNADQIELGKLLYFDKRLSANNTVSCNTCHNILNQGPGTDNLPTSKGIKGQLGARNAPTVWNAKFLSVQFWDGRAKDLAEQAKGPITNPVEMGIKDHDAAITKLKGIAGYHPLFKKAFPKDKDPINIDNVAHAIASFEETLESLNSPFDRYQKGDKKAISSQAVAGYKEFQKVGCTTCHSGDQFAGPKFPPGFGFYMKFPTYADAAIEKKYGFKKDLGRYEVTKKAQDKNMWRVAPLRNIARTAPYFHNGKVKDLKEAIRIMAKLQLGKTLKPKQVDEIHAFLVSLNGDLPKITEPTPVK